MGVREKELQGEWAALIEEGSVSSIRHAFFCSGKTLLWAQGEPGKYPPELLHGVSNWKVKEFQ